MHKLTKIAALKAERDRWKQHADSYMADVIILRVALDEILQANKGWDWEEIASQHWDIARRALERTK
jgi:hypothetical protein